MFPCTQISDTGAPLHYRIKTSSLPLQADKYSRLRVHRYTCIWQQFDAMQHVHSQITFAQGRLLSDHSQIAVFSRYSAPPAFRSIDLQYCMYLFLRTLRIRIRAIISTLIEKDVQYMSIQTENLLTISNSII